MATLTARVADNIKEFVEGFWAEHGEGPSSGVRRTIEEWTAMQRFPAIDFADGPAGRRARLRGGPDVWEIVVVARDYGDDRAGLREHFGFVAEADLDQALAYAADFPEHVDELIRGNERVRGFLERAAR